MKEERKYAEQDIKEFCAMCICSEWQIRNPPTLTALGRIHNTVLMCELSAQTAHFCSLQHCELP